MASKFPQGLRVLVVDDDPTCLKILQRLLQMCKYEVTFTNDPIIALQMLTENKSKFDIVITDVYMPKMDGFDLLQRVTDIPVILLSANDDTNLVMKGIEYGAVDYLLKPVRPEELKSIWKHVAKRKQNETTKGKPAVGSSSKNGSQKKKERVSSTTVEGGEGEKTTKQKQEVGENKRPRVAWTPELHDKFAVIVDYLGPNKAYPKKIHELMNVDGLTRANVASHLQKYRLYLKRMNVAPNHAINATYVPFELHESIYMDKNFSALCSLNDGGVGDSSAAIPPPPPPPPPPYYGSSFGGLLNQFTTPTQSGPSLSVGSSMPQHQTMSTMYRTPTNNNNNNNNNNTVNTNNYNNNNSTTNNNNNDNNIDNIGNNTINNEVFGNQTSIGIPPNNVTHSQVVAPMSEYAMGMDNWSKQPIPPLTNLTDNYYSIDVPQVPNAFDSSFANATNATLESDLNPTMNQVQAQDSPSILATMDPQGWNQNINDPTNMFGGLNNSIEPPYVFGGSSGDPTQFGQVGASNSSHYEQMGPSTLGPMQDIDDIGVNEVDILNYTNFYLEESDYLASLIEGPDEFVGEFQNNN